MTKKGLALYLGLTTKTIERYQDKGMPVIYINGILPRYDLEQVMEWQKKIREEKVKEVSAQINQDIKKALKENHE